MSRSGTIPFPFMQSNLLYTSCETNLCMLPVFFIITVAERESMSKRERVQVSRDFDLICRGPKTYILAEFAISKFLISKYQTISQKFDSLPRTVENSNYFLHGSTKVLTHSLWISTYFDFISLNFNELLSQLKLGDKKSKFQDNKSRFQQNKSKFRAISEMRVRNSRYYVKI